MFDRQDACVCGALQCDRSALNVHVFLCVSSCVEFVDQGGGREQYCCFQSVCPGTH